MSIYNDTLEKINILPDHLLIEINDFIDFLFLKYNININYEKINNFSPAESGMDVYLENLTEYEDLLANGNIKW
jgi:hypothetical protein